jgi:hypothetical protein
MEKIRWDDLPTERLGEQVKQVMVHDADRWSMFQFPGPRFSWICRHLIQVKPITNHKSRVTDFSAASRLFSLLRNLFTTASGIPRLTFRICCFMNLQITAGSAPAQAQGTVDHRLSTPNPGLHCDSALWTVSGASTAFHTSIPINDPCKTTFYCHNTVGTDHGTHPASGALFLKQFQGRNAAQIPDIALHATPPEPLKRAISQSINPMEAAVIWNGTASLISFFTPEREV